MMSRSGHLARACITGQLHPTCSLHSVPMTEPRTSHLGVPTPPPPPDYPPPPLSQPRRSPVGPLKVHLGPASRVCFTLGFQAAADNVAHIMGSYEAPRRDRKLILIVCSTKGTGLMTCRFTSRTRLIHCWINQWAKETKPWPSLIRLYSLTWK